MTILDVLTAPWAILPDKLVEIQAIYDAHVRGERIDVAEAERRLGRPLTNEQRRYEIVDGVAVIPVEGVMAKKMNLFSQISGGVSTELAARDIRAAATDPAVHSIIQVFDSPGGAAEGLQLMVDATRDARRAGRRVVSLASGTMASGAYWTGSAAEKVFVADAITQLGSIGVVATHRDNSVAQQQAGVKLTDVVAGKYKRIASSNGPLTDEGRASLQAMVDYVYSVFVSAVAEHRGTTVERVLSDMADGRVFIGEQAIAAGLADGFSTLDQLIVQLNRDRTASPARAPSTSKGVPSMTITREQLAAEAPELLSQLLAEGAASERARIQAVESALIPGHEALIASMKYDGKTSGGDAALAVNAAERSLRQKATVQLAQDAPTPVDQKPTPPVEQSAAKEDPTLPLEERCKATWEADTSVRAEFGSLAAYTAYRRAEEAGRVRQLGKRAA